MAAQATPGTKAARQAQIAAILAREQVHSQEQLAGLLSQYTGMHVTQATLSRDLDELGVVRLRAAGGALVYALPADPGGHGSLAGTSLAGLAGTSLAGTAMDRPERTGADASPPAPGGAVPGRAVTGRAVPGSAAPGSAAPGSAAPGRAVPGGAVPGSAAPGGAVPGGAAPGGAAPGRAAPGGAVPGSAAPGSAAPGRAVPGRAVPGKAAPGHGALRRAAPGQGADAGLTAGQAEEGAGQAEAGQAEAGQAEAGAGLVARQPPAVAGRGAGGPAPSPAAALGASPKLVRYLRELLTSAEASANLVVLRTPAGAAQFLASAIDHTAWPAILGTVAGDDTVLVIARDPAGGEALAEDFRRLAEGRR